MKKQKNDLLYIVLLFFCFFPYLQPASYCLNPFFQSVFNYWLKGSWLIAIIILILKKNINKTSLILIVFQAVFVLSTFLNKEYGSFQDSIYLFLNNFSIIVLSNYFFQKNKDAFLKYLSILFGILILLNIISFFIYYPNGMFIDAIGDRNYYFLEHDNGSFFYAFTVIFLLIANSLNKNNKISIGCYIFIIINFIAYFYIKSTVAYVSLFLLLIALLFSNNKILNRVVNSKIPFICLAILTSSLLIFNFYGNITSSILGFFQKDITMSGRTIIWKKSIEFIEKKPILGYGQELFKVRLAKFGISHVHNIFLQILYNGGLIALILFLIFYISLIKKINLNENKKIKYIFKMYLYLYLFASIFDFYNTKYIINIMYVCCFYNQFLIKEKEEKNE